MERRFTSFKFLVIFILSFLIITHLDCYGQKHDKLDVNAYRLKVNQFLNNNTDSVAKYANLGIEEAAKAHNFLELAEFYFFLSEQYISVGYFKKAQGAAYQGLIYANQSKNKHSIAKLGFNYVSSLLKNGDIVDGIKQLSDHLKFVNTHNFPHYQAKYYSYLASLNCSVENEALCQYYNSKANTIKNLSDRNPFLHNEISLYGYIQDKNTKLIDSVYKSVSIRILDKKIIDSKEINSIFVLGKYFHYAGMYTQSLHIFENLLKLDLDPEKCMVKEMKSLAAHANLYLKNYEEAYKLNEEVKNEILEEPHFRFLDKILETEAILYEREGKHAKALNSWKKHKQVVDSLSNLREHLNIITVEDFYSYEKVENKKDELDKENSKYRMFLTKLQKQQFLLWWLAGLLLLLLGSCIYLIIKVDNKNKVLQKNFVNIEQLNRNLRKSNKIKDKLFSLLGHELRSPIAELVGLLDVKKHISKMESALPYLDDIHVKSRALYVQLDNILTWSASELNNKPAHLDKLNLKNIVNENLQLGSVHLKQKKQTVIYDQKDAWIIGNETQALIVVRNIVHNAVKFTPEFGVIKIETIESDDFLDLVITDSGNGFLDCKLTENLTSIQESQEGTNGEKGSGVGLYITRDLMAKQKGEIFISNDVNLGGKVVLRFIKYKREQ